MIRRLTILILLITGLAMASNPTAQAQQGVCFSWSALCEEAGWTAWESCIDSGEDSGICNCRRLRDFNRCMELIGCEGHSEGFMLWQGCGPNQ